MFAVTDAWKAAYPGAAAGLLVMDEVENPSSHPPLDERKAALEARLRERYGRLTRADLVALPSVQPYVDHYKRFKKTYHVQLQLESVALKGKPLPRVAALVEAMFMAELENQLLTAGHDASVVDGPIEVDVSKDGDTFVAMNGQTQALQAGDMVMRDRRGVISSVVYGRISGRGSVRTPDASCSPSMRRPGSGQSASPATSTRSPQTFAPWRRTQPS